MIGQIGMLLSKCYGMILIQWAWNIGVTSYYPHGLIGVGVVYRKHWISVNWWSYLRIPYL
ncbi:hypothetical protein CMK10_13210 [Candidatus Poribacteria bacterium]|nr:hypothetical protein [Candidatus Poribacteria bacterium]